jgi:hypothetical protein
VTAAAPTALGRVDKKCDGAKQIDEGKLARGKIVPLVTLNWWWHALHLNRRRVDRK